jgi:hypothetical protein
MLGQLGSVQIVQTLLDRRDTRLQPTVEFALPDAGGLDVDTMSEPSHRAQAYLHRLASVLCAQAHRQQVRLAADAKPVVLRVARDTSEATFETGLASE